MCVYSVDWCPSSKIPTEFLWMMIKIPSIVDEMGFSRRADSTWNWYGPCSPISRTHERCWHPPPTFSLISCGVFYRCMRRRYDERCMCSVVWWFHAHKITENIVICAVRGSHDWFLSFARRSHDSETKICSRRQTINSISMLMSAAEQVLVSTLLNANVFPRGSSFCWK